MCRSGLPYTRLPYTRLPYTEQADPVLGGLPYTSSLSRCLGRR